MRFLVSLVFRDDDLTQFGLALVSIVVMVAFFGAFAGIR